MPAALVIECTGEVRQANGTQLHGFVFSVFQRLNDRLAEALHDERRKPFTLSPLLDAEFRPVWSGPLDADRYVGTCWLRVTILDDGLARALPGWLAGASLRGLSLAGQALEVRSVTADPAHPLAGVASYEELFMAGPGTHVDLRFLTPTSLRLGGNNLPLPEPVGLFRGYYHRWNAFSPIPAPPDVLAAIETGAPLALSRHRLTTSVYPLSPASQIGFVGQATFRLKTADGDLAAWLAALARLAFFAGSGYKTTMGMGLTVPRVRNGPPRPGLASNHAGTARAGGVGS